MIPETMAQVFPDVRSYLVTYKNGEYPYIGKEISHLQPVFLRKKLGKCIDGINFIRKNSDRIDVLNIYHLNLSSYLYCLAAKRYLKKDAVIFLKLDLGPAEIEKVKKRDPRSYIKRRTIKLADIVSGETTKLVGQLRDITGDDIRFITNGIYVPQTGAADPAKKKNKIITAGMLGTEPKNTHFLIDAFATYAKNAQNSDWKLVLIGKCTYEIEQKVKDLKEKEPFLSDRIILTGQITDKGQLAKEYEEAKIFILPSKWESFGFVLPEALSFGDHLLVSGNVPAAEDLLYNEDAGRIIRDMSVDTWAEEIDKATRADIDWEKKCREDHDFIEDNYNWKMIVRKIYGIINEKRTGEN
ncbi:MAG: glycosyltransferase family 4 protein [Lachnospiraceae bacterium]|nr:glycosyltransferase family 4 protein [Lachnospiraceae bacterium]